MAVDELSRADSKRTTQEPFASEHAKIFAALRAIAKTKDVDTDLAVNIYALCAASGCEDVIFEFMNFIVRADDRVLGSLCERLSACRNAQALPFVEAMLDRPLVKNHAESLIGWMERVAQVDKELCVLLRAEVERKYQEAFDASLGLAAGDLTITYDGFDHEWSQDATWSVPLTVKNVGKKKLTILQLQLEFRLQSCDFFWPAVVKLPKAPGAQFEAVVLMPGGSAKLAGDFRAAPYFLPKMVSDRMRIVANAAVLQTEANKQDNLSQDPQRVTLNGIWVPVSMAPKLWLEVDKRSK
jgi:hypothetical protein